MEQCTSIGDLNFVPTPIFMFREECDSNKHTTAASKSIWWGCRHAGRVLSALLCDNVLLLETPAN